MEPTRWYPTKVDTWLAVLLLGVPIMMVVAIVTSSLHGPGLWVGLGGLAFFGLIYGGLVWPMRYGMTDDELVVRSGLLRQRVSLGEIAEVSRTRNPLSAPALSLDRLEVRYGARPRYLRISPADRDGFLDELAARGKLRRDGDRLVR